LHRSSLLLHWSPSGSFVLSSPSPDQLHPSALPQHFHSSFASTSSIHQPATTLLSFALAKSSFEPLLVPSSQDSRSDRCQRAPPRPVSAQRSTCHPYRVEPLASRILHLKLPPANPAPGRPLPCTFESSVLSDQPALPSTSLRLVPGNCTSQRH